MTAKSLILTLAVAGVASGAYAQDYYDVTSAYLLNAGFDQRFTYAVGDTGNVVADNISSVGYWDVSAVKVGVLGVWQWGSAKTLEGLSVPAAGFGGEAGGGLAFGLSTTSGINILQDSVKLPAGDYKVVMAVYNASDNEEVSTNSSAWQPYNTRDASRVGFAKKNFAAHEWDTDTISFTLTKTVAGRIRLGFSARQANHALPIIDWVKILRATPIDASDMELKRADLQTAISVATVALGEATGSDADDYRDAISQAQAVLDNTDATCADLLQANADLQDATKNFKWISSVTVVTDTRYARGATMAFGRMTTTAKSSDVKEQGFVIGTQDKPTVADTKNTSTLTNNGTIYCFKNLQPATQYFMRAYVENKEGNVAYGNTIRFYTIPKGDIRATIRDISDEAIRQRITSAVNTAVDVWNNLTEMQDYRPNVGYNSGTPTADCSYGGYVRVGSNTSYQSAGTIMHEWLHGVGVIPWADTQWSVVGVLRAGSQDVSGSQKGSGNWLGERVSAVLDFWDNTTGSFLHGDYQHMWPYGINGANEDNHSDVLYYGNGLICQALGEDGLEHTYSHYAEPYWAFEHQENVKYYITNEKSENGLYTAYLAETGTSGSLTMVRKPADELADNDSCAWYVTFTPDNQFYQFRNAATGHYLTFNNVYFSAQDVTPAGQQDFQLMKGRVDVSEDGTRGYWITRHASRNPSTLAASNTGMVTRNTFNLANTATAQRWVILDEAQMRVKNNAALGIEAISDRQTQDQPTAREGVYTLDGRLVSRNATGLSRLGHGIYIVNGKKVAK